MLLFCQGSIKGVSYISRYSKLDYTSVVYAVLYEL